MFSPDFIFVDGLLFQTSKNAQELIDAVRARVPGPDRFQAGADEVARQVRVVEDALEAALHLGAVAGDEEILPGPKQAFDIVPR